MITGLDHIKELGVTHVHLLPSFDFLSIDETDSQNPQYNWGYDPQNYNVPEGSYSTDPYNGEVRIKEFKQMVKSLVGGKRPCKCRVVKGYAVVQRQATRHLALFL